jgi:hypothetical protein
MIRFLKPASRVEALDIPAWVGSDEQTPPQTPTRSFWGVYTVCGNATREELALVGVFGLALVLMLIIVGMALSQYLACFGSCTLKVSLL